MTDEQDQKDLGHEPNQTDGAQPAQIPLLDDVIFDTSLPFDVAKQKRLQATQPLGGQDSEEESAKIKRPRPTDLFGGSPETAQSGPLTPEYRAVDMDHATSLIKGNTEQVVDSLVAEYSKEIISRLRDDLTSILEDLDRTNERPAESTVESQPEFTAVNGSDDKTDQRAEENVESSQEHDFKQDDNQAPREH